MTPDSGTPDSGTPDSGSWWPTGPGPCDRSGQALVHRDLGKVAKIATGGGDVGLAAADVARSRRRVSGVGFHAHERAQAVEQLHQADRAAAGNVVGPARASVGGSQGGRQIGRNGVVHEGEIPALQPVAVYLRRLMVQKGVDEEGDDGGVGRVGAL